MMARSAWLQRACVLASALPFAIAGGGLAGAQEADRSAAELVASIRNQVIPCFNPPTGTSAPARIAATIAADGSIEGEPTIVEAGEGAANQTLAAAGVRAVLRCAPFDVDYEGEIVLNFDAVEMEAAQDSQAADDATQMAAVSGEAAAGAAIPFPAKAGFCFVDPERSEPEADLWNVMAGVGGGFVSDTTMAVDCDILARALEGDIEAPRQISIVARTDLASPATEDLPGFLDRIAEAIEASNPADPRFFEAPPSEATVYDGRDERAAYSAGRWLTDGGDTVRLTVLTAYTKIDGETYSFILSTSDGTDIESNSWRELAKTVQAAHRSAGE